MPSTIDHDGDSVPADFPDVGAEGALGGAQLKFNAVRDSAGHYWVAGRSPVDRQRNFLYCCEVVNWGASFLLEKAAKPKYIGAAKSRLLIMFDNNLKDDLDIPLPLRRWIVAKVADRMGWSEGSEN